MLRDAHPGIWRVEFVIWTHLFCVVSDGKDWLQPPAEEMLSSITNGLSSGEIVLLHDGTDRPEDTARSSRHETVRLLPMLIEHVQKIGFEWVSLSTVLRTGSPVYVYWPPEPPQPGQPPQRRRR